jgi:hypothetical protein
MAFLNYVHRFIWCSYLFSSKACLFLVGTLLGSVVQKKNSEDGRQYQRCRHLATKFGNQSRIGCYLDRGRVVQNSVITILALNLQWSPVEVQVPEHLRRIRGCEARIRRESGACHANATRKIRVYDERHVARVHYANAARSCRARSAQQGMLLLDPDHASSGDAWLQRFSRALWKHGHDGTLHDKTNPWVNAT